VIDAVIVGASDNNVSQTAELLLQGFTPLAQNP
jgi:hypothetical protein